MSSSNLSQRKKKQKNGKPASVIPIRSKQIKKKQKTRLTRDYEDNEKEVQQLLENFNLNIESPDVKDDDFDTQSIEFFCSERQIYTASNDAITRSPVTEEESTELSDSIKSEDSNESQRTFDINEEGERTYDVEPESSSYSKTMPESSNYSKTTPEQSSIRNGNQNQTASTFIQIESIQHDLFTHFPSGVRFKYNRQLVFRPNATLHRSIQLNSRKELLDLTSNAKRMINRFYEESKSVNGKVSKAHLEALQKSKESNAFLRVDPTVYRSFCLHKFHPIFCEAMPCPIEIPIPQFIKLYLKELRFTQHPHLCEEHSLANELEDMYEEYTDRQRKSIGENLERNLKLERNVVNGLMKQISSENHTEHRDSEGPSYTEEHFQALQEHLFKVKELRTRLYEEEAYNKRLLKDILDKWIQLKKLRHTQEFQCTRFKLRIQVQELTSQIIKKARKEWATRFQADLSELYREELEVYYTAKRLWKQAHDSPTDLKPKKPKLSNLSAELKDKYSESFYMPEEPKIDVQRSRVSDEEFYENTKKMINNGSQPRKLRSYFIRIYFDREFVAESRTYRLEPDLSLRINEAFGIFLERRLPKNINIALYEKSRIAAPYKIAKITVPLPQLLSSQNSSKDENSIFNIQFTSKKEPMAGRLYFGLKCHKETSVEKHLLTVPTLTIKESEQRKQTPMLETSDDEEPESMTETSQDTCTFEETLLQFCSLDELKCNSRFKLLRSRYLKNDDRTRDLCLVPALENELEFDCENEEDAVIETGNWMDPIDLHKHRGKKYLKTLYEAIRNQCSRLDKANESIENLLIGNEPGSWSLLLSAFASIFHPGRPLNPVRNDIIKSKNLSSLQWDGLQNFNVHLNVVRATGIPIRAYTESSYKDDSRQRSSESSNMFITQNLKYSNVRPFVALSYKDKFCRTTAAEGSNPTWNEQLIIQLNGSLADLRDDLKITLFDEIIESHVNDDLSIVNIYQRVQMNFLGEYRIPISTILQRQKLEDHIELNVPQILLGYKRPSLDSISTALDTNIVVEMKESVQLVFYLNIEPTFELPSVNTKTLECSELREVRQHLHEWSLIVRELRPLHFVEPLVCTEDGKRVCITRLLEPVPLPFETSENLLDSICRYVSLLNSMKCYDPCIGYRGVWLNNQVLLDTTWGSAKDMGVLLCNFLLSLGLKCWLVLGQSNTYGETTFVLYKSEDNNINLLEPCSGKRYFIKDVLIPMYSISCVISQDNIYCNMQSETRVTMMNFNFNDTSCWLPAFNKRNPAPLGGIQQLKYSFHDTLSTLELTKNIERKIMKKINSWRAMRRTVWNRAFQSHLYNLLLEMESKSTFKDSTVHVNSRYAEQIVAEYPAHKLYGFTLNFSYVNLSTISDRIRSTGIHLNSDKNVEFSLAVHVHKYPNNVLSVWIFLISIVPILERLTN